MKLKDLLQFKITGSIHINIDNIMKYELTYTDQGYKFYDKEKHLIKNIEIDESIKNYLLDMTVLSISSGHNYIKIKL